VSCWVLGSSILYPEFWNGDASDFWATAWFLFAVVVLGVGWNFLWVGATFELNEFTKRLTDEKAADVRTVNETLISGANIVFLFLGLVMRTRFRDIVYIGGPFLLVLVWCAWLLNADPVGSYDIVPTSLDKTLDIAIAPGIHGSEEKSIANSSFWNRTFRSVSSGRSYMTGRSNITGASVRSNMSASVLQTTHRSNIMEHWAAFELQRHQIANLPPDMLMGGNVFPEQAVDVRQGIGFARGGRGPQSHYAPRWNSVASAKLGSYQSLEGSSILRESGESNRTSDAAQATGRPTEQADHTVLFASGRSTNPSSMTSL